MSNDLKRDDGKRLDKQNYETKAGYNKFDLLSLLQKCTRRSPHNEEDREVMMWASWELCRSSYYSEYWARIDKIAIEDALLGIEESHLLLVLERLRELATEQFDPSEGFGLACAMRASSLLYEATASHELLVFTGERVVAIAYLEAETEWTVIADEDDTDGDAYEMVYGELLEHRGYEYIDREDAMQRVVTKLYGIPPELIEAHPEKLESLNDR